MCRTLHRRPCSRSGAGSRVNATGLLVFARCAGFIFRSPGFSHPSVPPSVRAGLALVMAIGLIPGVQTIHTTGGMAFAVAIACDFGIGAAIGMAASVLYDGAYCGGRVLDDYVGIRGSVPNAHIVAASAFGRIWSLVFTAGFFLLGGYRVIVYALMQSFRSVPPGGLPGVHDLYGYAVALPRSIVEAALLVAAPAIALVFVAQVTLGALARVIPRFAAFTLSFPIIFGVALCATLLAAPLLFNVSGVPWLRVPFLRMR
jgi:flagellar biosynthetic protein FliR